MPCPSAVMPRRKGSGRLLKSDGCLGEVPETIPTRHRIEPGISPPSIQVELDTLLRISQSSRHVPDKEVTAESVESLAEAEVPPRMPTGNPGSQSHHTPATESNSAFMRCGLSEPHSLIVVCRKSSGGREHRVPEDS